MKRLKCQRGLATLESVPMLLLFLLLIAFSLGAFGIIHTAILNSIAARNYAFETFRHRANLKYFRDNRLEGAALEHYKDVGYRRHRVISEIPGDVNVVYASERSISFAMNIGEVQNRDETTHNEKILQDQTLFQGGRNDKLMVNPVWVTGQYGICLDTICGGD